jgi:predicted anti-sigma-YlaC factor YlaD
MMNCKRIRELLLTDYLDGESPASERREIEEHLQGCAKCRFFAQSVREKISQPLRQLKEIQPPETVWQQIRETIVRQEAETSATSFLEKLWDALAANFLAHRPAYAVSTVLAVSLAIVVFLHSPLRREMVVSDYLRQQTTFMASLSAPVNGELESEFSFGSSAEQLLF